jgi:beta-lactamase regulating signal transducer with metallopeptidase domain
MNTIGIALLWCVVQVTLIGLLAAGLYLVARRLRPAAAASVVLTGLATVVVLSLFVLSPWPRWTIHRLTTPPAALDSAPVSLPTEQGAKTARLDNSRPSSAGEGQPVKTSGGNAVSIKNRPSSATILWQTLLDELAAPQAAAQSDAWRWPAVMAVLLLAAMACGLGWLLLGVAAVRWQRLRSRPVVDGPLLALVEVLRAELGCRRRVEVRQSDDLTTAATIGWRRPVLFLPADWTTWTVAQRRAVLAHEIVHARSHDFIALLLGQIGLSLHFYHPLLHWLIGRLRLEQELAADAVAASVSGGQRQYLLTIAELALRRQDRPLFWPARSFLPTQTTFLRRIAMLRDSKVRIDRLSPVTRLITVGAVLLCGLLVAGLRGPAGQPQLLAADRAGATASDGSMDTSFMIDSASAMVVIRPAAIFSRPEFAPLAMLLDKSSIRIPGTRLADFRQITVIEPVPAYSEIMVFQGVKPIVDECLMQLMPDKKYTISDYHGKKMYRSSYGNRVILKYDDRTIVTCRTEQALDVYMSAKRGALPKWLPAKAWESLRGDDYVIVADMTVMRPELEKMVYRFPAIVQAAFASVSPVWEDSTALAAGARLDNRLAADAWAATKDTDSSERLRRTTEVLKTLLQGAVKNTRTAVQSGQQPSLATILPLLDVADSLLDNVKFQQEGSNVRLQMSIELDDTRLGVLVSAFVAATQPPDASTKAGMMALVEDFFHHNWHDVTSRETLDWGEPTKTKDGNFSIRYKFRARYWYGEPKIVERTFTFTPDGTFVSAEKIKKRPASPAQVYEVHKKVSDFPDREDLSTPEAAYASIHRAYVAEGDAAWPRLSVPWQAERMPPAGAKRPLPKETADRLLGAEILEVHVWDGKHAVVIAREERSDGRDYMGMRWLDRVEGRWLNESNDSRRTIEQARQKIEQSRE